MADFFIILPNLDFFTAGLGLFALVAVVVLHLCAQLLTSGSSDEWFEFGTSSVRFGGVTLGVSVVCGCVLVVFVRILRYSLFLLTVDVGVTISYDHSSSRVLTMPFSHSFFPLTNGLIRTVSPSSSGGKSLACLL